MNRTEIAKLLTIIAKTDNRSFDEPTVVLWQGMLGDLPFDACSAAVIEHYRESTAWLMPAHIVGRVRAKRQDTAMRQLPATPAPRALPSGDGVQIPGAPSWTQAIYQQARQRQREINEDEERKEQGLRPAYGNTEMSPLDGRLGA